MPTAQQIFNQSWIDLGVGEPGQTPPASQSVNGLNKLNIFLDMLSGVREMVYEIADLTFALISAQTFAIGPTAASPFNVARPNKIENAQILITVGGQVLSHDLEIVTQAEWQSIDDKGATGTIPTKLYFDPSVPNASLNLWPIPLASATTQLDIGVWKFVGQFAALSTNANLPPAYYNLLVLGLQLQLVPTYGNLISPSIIQIREQQFEQAFQVVKGLNASVQMMQTAPAAPPASQNLTNPQLSQLLQQLRANSAVQRAQ